ncbi:hypothetical protein [Gordonia sp. CNJ-863]|uniref:hypothetical protein n=1 Tax=Gordonia sp. CNJ-863 TaxID=1904963 RepID=UPI000AD9C00E|nr:hypothetical protein [Gordonia sp. CNJ-863]
MPQLQKSNIQELTCPSPDPKDPIKVTIDLAPYGGLAEDILDPVTQTVRVSSGPIAAAILDWNLIDDAGKKEAITSANVRRLPKEALEFLANKLFGEFQVAVEAKPVGPDEKKD